MTGAVTALQRPPGRGGALMLVALLMIGSAALRLSLEAGPALAREISQIPANDKVSTSERASPDAPELNRLLQDLLGRERALKQREAAFQDRMKALEIADRALASRMSALQDAEEGLRSTLAVADVAAEDDLTQLTEVYENMKPKEAAALFEEMDPAFAAGFLARMKADAAAGIMAGMNPQSAYTISVVLAGRNASAPRQ